MKKEHQALRAPSGDRLILSEVVPLPAPQCIRIEPAQLCNFRCEYCPSSLRDIQHLWTHELCDFDLFLSIVEDIKKSFHRVKTIMLVGAGESLLHPKIADMVAAIQERELAETVEITTNASLLTPKLSDALVSAGLSLIRISVNGLSDADYKKHCDVKLDFDEYVRNIRYLFEHRGKTRVYIKILNYMVSDPEKYERFFRIFEPVSDIISVENLIKTSPRIDYEAIAGEGIAFNQTQSNTELMETKICSMPFYTLQINMDGRVYPCCDFGEASIGDIRTASLREIWDKAAFTFQRKMLDGVDDIPFCRTCMSMRYRVYPEDRLDGHAQRLKEKYDALAGRR